MHNTGILNIGNSCYLNSSLQMLFNSNDFVNICRGTVFENIINNYKSSKIFNPTEIKAIVAKNNKMFNNTQQQDSFEFIIYLFDILDKILGSTKNYDNLLYNKFGIIITTNIKCKMSNCNKESNTNVTELFLELPITDELDLSDSYRKYKSMTILQDDNSYYCDNCKTKVLARKNTITTKWPDSLIIVFKRFDYQMRKDNRSINIPLIWRHGYKLKGAIIHMGSYGGGHYIYFGHNNNLEDKEWFIANDSSISKINDIDSFINHQGKQSYILYYEKDNRNYS